MTATITMARKTARRLRVVLIGLPIMAVLAGNVITAAAHESSAGPSSGSNVATRWVDRALDAVRSGTPGIHTVTPGAGRTYAMTTLAMYDAVNGIESASGTSTRGAAILPSYAGAPAAGDRAAAASAAAHAVLSSLFAANAGVKQDADTAHAQELAALGSDPAVEAGRAWGARVGSEIVAIRSDDGTQTPASASGGNGPGVFPRTFSGTQFRDMAPVGVAAVEPYTTKGPPALDSETYAADLNEVKALGSASDTDPERATIARHWLAEANTVRETGLWLKAALVAVADQGTAASLSDTVRLFALLGMGIADSVAVSWTDKFTWHYWRPGDAIRQADSDGNPATTADPMWSPRNGVCANTDVRACAVFGGTPEHTSGTSMFAGASATILATFYCTDAIPFSFTGEQPNSPPRSYDGFAEAAREAGRSRIYGGIHFQFSNDAGREAGKAIGQEISRTRLSPTGVRPGRSSACK